MNVFFEESGDFKSGTVLSQQGEAFQVEQASGKRCKVKGKDVLLHFTHPEPAELLERARALASELDLDFLWEVAGSEEFGFAELGQEYFGHAPEADEAAGLILALHGAPIYFHRKGRGRYKAAPAETLKAALAGLEKKRLLAERQAAYVQALLDGDLPEALRKDALSLLFRPDKNSIEYKALQQACDTLHVQPARLMLERGGVAHARALHEGPFLLEHFPKGTHFPALPAPVLPQDLPLAEVEAFSIDDVTTTEIDDAFSVTRLDADRYRIGIHIAAPALAIEKGDAIDTLARTRLSTVYMPGDKITMLPDDLVDIFTLGAGSARPALSLYATIDAHNWSVLACETRIEAVPVKSNLRHNQLDEDVTEAALAAGSGDYPHKDDLAILWPWAQALERTRMEKRAAFGLPPEQNNRVDFNFYVENDQVSIQRRKRGAPLDKIVAELMIFANSTWGKMLDDHGVPGIYRAQGASGGRGPGGWTARMQVRMQTHAAPHQGLGVDQYVWSTSPLRRYTDLVNQWQIIACVRHGITAKLAAPFKPKDADLFAIISAFDTAYAAYAQFQSTMERYWCLRWLAQTRGTETTPLQLMAAVLKEDVLRLQDIPLVLRLPGMPPLARGTQVRLDLLSWDELDLSVEARLIEALDSVAEEELDDDAEDSSTPDETPTPVEVNAASAEAAVDAPSAQG